MTYHLSNFITTILIPIDFVCWRLQLALVIEDGKFVTYLLLILPCISINEVV
jgi:hypothetical protein